MSTSSASPPSGLPRLVGRGDLMRDMGISERQADHIFRELGAIRLPGSGRSFVRLDEVLTMLKHYSFRDQ